MSEVVSVEKIDEIVVEIFEKIHKYSILIQTKIMR